MAAPIRDRLDLFQRQSGKKEMWVSCLPRQSFSFVYRELEHSLIVFQNVSRLRENGSFNLPHLRDNLLAGSVAQIAKFAREPRVWPLFIGQFRFHHSDPFFSL
jgi:hypothetical protein